MIFGRLVTQILFQEICFSSGKQAIHKVSAAFIVKKYHPRTSLKSGFHQANYDRDNDQFRVKTKRLA